MSQVSVAGVELMHAGAWGLQSGQAEFTVADLLAAKTAMECPAVRNPALKLGHVEPMFVGEPALGFVANLSLEEYSLRGDFIGMPAWLSEQDADGNSVLASAYPDRSVEAQRDYVCQIGHTHPFVIHAVALLGVERPGIGTLESLQELYGIVATADQEENVSSTIAVTASVTTDAVRQAYYSGPASGNMNVWVAEVRLDPSQLIVADESTGKAYRVPFTVTGDAVEFADRTEVRSEWVDAGTVAAAVMAGKRQIFASRAESRPESIPDDVVIEVVPTTEGTGMDPVKIREALGLSAEASDSEVTAALVEANVVSLPTPPEPVAALPEGTVVIDSAQLAELQVAASAGLQARQEQLKARRESVVAAAVSDGRIPPARREHWVSQIEADPGAEQVLASMAKGLIPVTESGYAATADVSDEDATYAALFGADTTMGA